MTPCTSSKTGSSTRQSSRTVHKTHTKSNYHPTDISHSASPQSSSHCTPSIPQAVSPKYSAASISVSTTLTPPLKGYPLQFYWRIKDGTLYLLRACSWFLWWLGSREWYRCLLRYWISVLLFSFLLLYRIRMTHDDVSSWLVTEVTERTFNMYSISLL